MRWQLIDKRPLAVSEQNYKSNNRMKISEIITYQEHSKVPVRFYF